MIKVNQTSFGDGKGNCFTACVASCLELPIESVPDFCLLYGDREWWFELEKWLALRGLAPLEICFAHGEDVDPKGFEQKIFYLRPDIPLILSGKNAAGVAHCVVVYDDNKIHNPNPNPGSDLVSYRDVIVLIALHPERQAATVSAVDEPYCHECFWPKRLCTCRQCSNCAFWKRNTDGNNDCLNVYGASNLPSDGSGHCCHFQAPLGETVHAATGGKNG